ncbi:MAG: hypothetical protein WC713_11970 [Candidatus Methylomirabilota bacterium]
MGTFFWGINGCPHCGQPINGKLADLQRLGELFDEASREKAESVPLAISCPHCCGMIRMTLQPTVTVTGLDKLALGPMRLTEGGELMTAPRKVVRRKATP